jgi:hypothetical protein
MARPGSLSGASGLPSAPGRPTLHGPVGSLRPAPRVSVPPTDSPVRRLRGHEFACPGPGRPTDPRAVPSVPRHLTPAHPGAPAPHTTDMDRPSLASPTRPQASRHRSGVPTPRQRSARPARPAPSSCSSRSVRRKLRPPTPIRDPARRPASRLARTRRLTGTMGHRKSLRIPHPRQRQISPPGDWRFSSTGDSRSVRAGGQPPPSGRRGSPMLSPLSRAFPNPAGPPHLSGLRFADCC